MLMTIDSKKVYLACADQCKSFNQAATEAGLSSSIKTELNRGNARINAGALGRLAKALKVAPADLLKDDQ